MLNSPKLSIVLPVKNGMRYLEDSKQSLLSNCQMNDEILVIDDNSTDETLNFINDWRKRDSRVRLLRNKGSGLVSALNFGVAESQNEWIARFDVDDKYANDRLNLQRAEIKSGVVAVFSDYTVFKNDNLHLGTIPSAVFPSAVSLSLKSSQRTAHPSVIFSRNAALSAGGYRSDDFLAEDLSLWLRLSRIGKLKSIPTNLLFYRISNNSISSRNRPAMIRKRSEILKEIGVLESDIKSVGESWEQIFRDYEDLSHSATRQILLCQDFYNCVKPNVNRKNAGILALMARKITSNPTLILNGLNYQFDRLRRRALR